MSHIVHAIFRSGLSAVQMEVSGPVYRLDPATLEPVGRAGLVQGHMQYASHAWHPVPQAVNASPTQGLALQADCRLHSVS